MERKSNGKAETTERQTSEVLWKTQKAQKVVSQGKEGKAGT